MLGGDQRNANAGRDQIDAGQHLLDLGDDERFEAGLMARLNDVAVHARSGMAAYQNQPLACQRAQRDWRGLAGNSALTR